MTKRIETLILPAAGFGTRMKCVHPTLPKELLSLGSRRVLEYALLEAEDASIRTVVCVLRRGKENIREFLENHPTGMRIVCINQDEQIGEGDAILLARDCVGELPFAVLYPDNVGYPAPGMLREVCEAFNATGKEIVALMQVTPELAPGIGNSGRVRLLPPCPASEMRQFEPGQTPKATMLNGQTGQTGGGHSATKPALRPILEFLPKGPGSFPLSQDAEWRTCGLFASQAHFFEAALWAKQTGFAGELTDGKVRRVLLEQGVEFYGLPLSRRVYDVGNPVGYGQLCALLGPNQK